MGEYEGRNNKPMFNRCVTCRTSWLASDSVVQRLNQRVSRVDAAVGSNRLRRGALRIGFDHQLRGVAVVVSQHAAQPLTTFNVPSDLPDFFVGIDDLVLESLVVSFPVIVGKVFANSASQGVLAVWRYRKSAC